MRMPAPACLALLPGLVLCDAAALAAQAMATRPARPTVVAESLLEDLRVLAADSMEGRRTGTAGAERARRYIETRFAETGLEPVGAEFRQPLERTARDVRSDAGVNLVGRVEGRSPGRVIVVSAHYDHVGVRDGQVFNGADDNASGVAALLAVAGALAAEPPQHTVLLVAFDAEERGLRGARAFVAAPPVPLEDIAVNVNFDMVSRNEKGELWVAGTHPYPFFDGFVKALAGRSGVTLKAGHDRPGTGADDWTGQSDHAAFHAAGVPFLYFGVEDHRDYHRPTDDFERIEPGFFIAATETLLDAVRTLDRELDQLVPRR